MADVLELENAEEFEDDSISRMKASPFSSDPDPDPRFFWPPGSGSTSQRYGSGSGSRSFYHHAKLIRKILNPTIL
jgi:hypothetical protein